MTKEITEAQFAALVSQNAIETENDVEYSYTNVIDSDGNEIAFASHHTSNGTKFYLRNA